MNTSLAALGNSVVTELNYCWSAWWRFTSLENKEWNYYCKQLLTWDMRSNYYYVQVEPMNRRVCRSNVIWSYVERRMLKESGISKMRIFGISMKKERWNFKELRPFERLQVSSEQYGPKIVWWTRSTKKFDVCFRPVFFFFLSTYCTSVRGFQRSNLDLSSHFDVLMTYYTKYYPWIKLCKSFRWEKTANVWWKFLSSCETAKAEKWFMNEAITIKA